MDHMTLQQLKNSPDDPIQLVTLINIVGNSCPDTAFVLGAQKTHYPHYPLQSSWITYMVLLPTTAGRPGALIEIYSRIAYYVLRFFFSSTTFFS